MAVRLSSPLQRPMIHTPDAERHAPGRAIRPAPCHARAPGNVRSTVNIRVPMGLRTWIRARMADPAHPDGDASPLKALVYSIVGRDEDGVHALGEYTADTYPA